jgi:hypothetical protein
MLAYVYNQTEDHRLVVIDEKSRHRYEAPLKEANTAPFWEGGRIYSVDVTGVVRGFRIGSDKLVAEKEEAIAEHTVAHIGYDRSQHRLYLIQVEWSDEQKSFFYELSAIDFPARKSLWTKRIDEPGLLRIIRPYVCVTGLRLVQVFNCDSGEKLGEIEVANAPTPKSPDANEQK